MNLRFKHFLFVLPVIGIASGILYFKSKSEPEMNLKLGDVQESIYGLGKVKSDRVFEFKLGVIASIRKAHVKEGDEVKTGQRLLDFDSMESLFAPFDGVIVSRPFNERENVFPQVPILRLEDLKRRYVEVALEQQGALRVEPKQNAKFSFESLRGKTFAGTVESIYPSRDQFFVRIKPEHLPEEILPGMTADVAIEVGKKEKVLLVPNAAVVGGKVTRIRDGEKEKIEVKIGISDGEWAELESGDLKVDDKVLIPRKK
jgi:membrane fusion protein, macrolide-specific efflux system